MQNDTIPFLLDQTGFHELEQDGGELFRTGKNQVIRILAPRDRKVEFIFFETGQVLTYIKSGTGYPAYYPFYPASVQRPIRAVLMDLDGTSVRSESFWIWIIERSIASLLNDPSFKLSDRDFPHVSGHSVSEHLQYCINTYCPEARLERARQYYFEHTHREMKEILEGRGKKDAFTPTPGLKDFLLALKKRGILIGLVTSGLHEKAWPEIMSAFHVLDMGDPVDFYDAIITAGFPMRQGLSPGTLGELSPKPHPWLYAEISRVGLGIPFEDRGHVIGIEDSGAGVCSIRLAGFAAVGLAEGNILQSGTRGLCHHFCETLGDILNIIDG